MNCSNCNALLPPGAKFCSQCGTTVAGAAPSSGSGKSKFKVRVTPEHYVVELNGHPYLLEKEQVHTAAKTAAVAIAGFLARRRSGGGSSRRKG